MTSRYPAPSQPRSGQPLQSHGVSNLAPPNRLGHTSSPLDSPPRPPGLYRPNPVYEHEPLEEQTSEEISGWLVICLMALLLQTILIMSHPDPLEKFIDIESAAQHASMENSTLALEKEKTEREREMIGRERELWEKAREDRVPQGAFWDPVWPAYDCRAYGKREYWGILRNIPEGWSAIDACMNMPVEIKGVTIRRPYRCTSIWNSWPQIYGYWMVDWDQPDCKPYYRDYQNAGCTSYKSGKRRIEAQIVGINNKREQNWRLLCNSTPLVWDMITYTSPTHCEERAWGKKVAMWDVPDESCL